MADSATTRQKQFLRRLGHKDVANLTKTQASGLIEKLLEQERQSGKQFSCPYCKQKFGPRPKRKKKCPHCGKTIYHITGQFLTEGQLDELNQKEWVKNERANTKENIRDDWKDEREFRREFGDVDAVGYLIKIGPNCPHAVHLNGTVVKLEDAKEHPELLPPYDACRHDTCQCEFEPVSADEIPRGTRVAGLQPQRKSGCVGVLLAVIGFTVIVGCVLAQNLS